MQDIRISITRCIAYTLWALGSVTVVLSVIFSHDGVGHVGMLAAGGGAILTVRYYLLALVEREVAAFELGRNVSMIDEKVRNLR